MHGRNEWHRLTMCSSGSGYKQYIRYIYIYIIIYYRILSAHEYIKLHCNFHFFTIGIDRYIVSMRSTILLYIFFFTTLGPFAICSSFSIIQWRLLALLFFKCANLDLKSFFFCCLLLAAALKSVDCNPLQTMN